MCNSETLRRKQNYPSTIFGPYRPSLEISTKSITLSVLQPRSHLKKIALSPLAILVLSASGSFWTTSTPRQSQGYDGSHRAAGRAISVWSARRSKLARVPVFTLRINKTLRRRWKSWKSTASRRDRALTPGKWNSACKQTSVAACLSSFWFRSVHEEFLAFCSWESIFQPVFTNNRTRKVNAKLTLYSEFHAALLDFIFHIKLN